MPKAARAKSSAATAAVLNEPDLGELPSWNLGDLYAGMDDRKLKADLKKAEADAVAFEEKYKGKIVAIAEKAKGGAELAEAIVVFEEMEELLGRIVSYAGLVHAENTGDPVRSKFYGDIAEKITAASAHMLFFGLELNRIPDAALEKALKAPALAHYRPWVEDVRKEKPYQLEDRVELLFHEKSVTAAGAWNRLFDETMASLRFTVDGKVLPIEPTLNFLQDGDEKKRKTAAEALAATFKENIRVFTHITNVLAKDKEISDRWRGFEDIADARHLANRVEREVVDALVEAVRASFPQLSHRYYKMKAKWFGKEKLEHWDRNAPLPKVPARSIPFAEAQTTVLDAFGRFEPEMAKIAKRFFDDKWIDAPVRTGKAPGAFSHPTVPSAHPYVLVNYQGKVRDVMTLAHELGHGVHQVLAAPQGALMAPTPLTLAETASVFGEMLTFRSVLSGMTDKKQRKALTAAKVEDMLNTVVRQIAFYTFERKVHSERRQGELTSEQIGEIWMDVQSESLGPAIQFHPGYETYWCYIPHFIHSPFYVYAYAFGDCLVNSLFAEYEGAAKGFQQKYFELLKAGGTKHHKELLAPFGLDASDPKFWGKGLKVLERLIDDLEKMEG